MFETNQSIVAAVFMVLTLLIELVIMILSSGALGLAYWALYLIVGIPLTILAVYTINCLVMGSCRVLSWFHVAFIILEFLFFLVIMILAIVTTSSTNPQTQAKANTGIAVLAG